MKRFGLVVVVALLSALGAIGLTQRVTVHRKAALGLLYYAVDRGRPIHFPAQGRCTAQLNLRTDVSEDTQAIVRLRDTKGDALAQYTIALHSHNAQPRHARVPLVLDALTSTIELDSESRIYARLAVETVRHSERSETLLRIGINAALVSLEEVTRIGSPKLRSVAAVDAATVYLTGAGFAQPPPTVTPLYSTDRASSVGPGALVWNVHGPGRARLLVRGEGRFIVQTRSAGLWTTREVSAPTQIELPITEGTNSVVMLPDGCANGTALLDGVVGLSGNLPTPEWRARHLWPIADGNSLRVALSPDGRGEPVPLRVTVRASNLQRRSLLGWRFVDARGRHLLQGTMTTPVTPDPFVLFNDSRQPVGTALVQSFVPPRGAAALELESFADALTLVEALIDDDIPSDYEPPYDQVPDGLYWIDAPAHLPRWVALRPTFDQAHTPGMTALVHMPRLERASVQSAPSLVTLPIDTPIMQLIERAKRKNDREVVVLADREEAVVRIPSEGDRARRLAIHCSTRDELGGRVALLIDGATAARTRFTTGGVDLLARPRAGVHRVKVLADSPARCILEAVPAQGRGLVERLAWALPDGVLRLRVNKPGWQPHPITFVIYVASDQRTPELHLDIDQGELRRRSGAVGCITSLHAPRRDMSSLDPVIQHGRNRRLLRRALVTTAMLGDDLAPGRHVLQLSLTPSTPALLRAFAPGQPPQQQKVESWVTTEDDP
jgi:hypothetical protein